MGSKRPEDAYGFLSRSEEHTSELQSPCNLVCRLLPEKKLTPSTMVTSTPLPGAEISTLRAPPFRCRAAPSRLRNFPVDSITTSAPSLPQSICAGSRSDSTAMGVPSMISESGVCSTVRPSRPKVESKASRCASVPASVMSLTATTCRSVRSSASRVNTRPIRPKPLIPTLVVICFLLVTDSLPTQPRPPATPAGSADRHRPAGPMAPQLAQPQLAQPQLAQPQLAQPQLAQPQLAQPQLAEPGAVDLVEV